MEDKKTIDRGYLLSPRDLCSLDYLPQLINIGVHSLKVEGRMKTPEYVAEVTKVYRKYIDYAYNAESFSILEQDKKDLLQVFNRGNFSDGHLAVAANKELIYPKKQNNEGIYLGKIENYNNNKGYIKIKLNESVSIGDTLAIDGETGTYTISELMVGNQNLKNADAGSIVVLGRMKGKIKVGSKVYRITSKQLNSTLKPTYQENTNFKRIPITCHVIIKRNKPIKVSISSKNSPPFYNDISIQYESGIIPEVSINCPITRERIYEQFSKLGSEPYYIESFEIELDDNLYITHISDLNQIRRNAISKFKEEMLRHSNKIDKHINFKIFTSSSNNKTKILNIANRKISLLLESIHSDYNYMNLNGITNLYIPLKFFSDKSNDLLIENLSKKFNMYVYMPTIIKANYKNLLLNSLSDIIHKFSIKGFVISNIAGFTFLKDYINTGKYDIVSNYTLNVFNIHTINELKKLGVSRVVPSIELDSGNLDSIIYQDILPVELIAYGRSVLMNSSYCLLGKTNKCYPECAASCSSNNKYYLKDRFGYKFRILPDNLQTVTSIYNSKITSIETKKWPIPYVRINILDESIEEINEIINVVKSGNKFDGKNYTNGNLNRKV